MDRRKQATNRLRQFADAKHPRIVTDVADNVLHAKMPSTITEK
jgi:hypothetical protein